MVLLNRYAKKLLRLLFGFFLMALGISISKQAFCLSPWHVLNDGLSHVFPITIGQANLIVGTLILLIGVLAHETLGFGMFLNIWLVGVFTDWILYINTVFPVLPKIHFLPAQLLCCGGAVVCNALGSYFYMSAKLGTGPRDTLIVFLAKHSPLPVGGCKLLLEALACLVGWLIGGEVGVGTFISVLLGGPTLQLVLRLFRYDVKATKNESIRDTVRIIFGKSPVF